MDVPVWIALADGTMLVGVRGESEDNRWVWCNCYGDFWYDPEVKHWRTGTAEEDDEYPVTHWMALPDPPSA